MTQIELKQCPFCGSNAELNESYVGNSVRYYVGCASKRCYVATSCRRTIKSVVNVWNRRAKQ